jgi:hypothetical protein
MHDSLPVRAIEGLGDLRAVALRLSDRQRPLDEALGQTLPLEILHDQEGRPIGRLSHVVERADVRMIQSGDRPRLAFQPLSQVRAFRQSRRKDLDRHHSIQAPVARAIDLAHPSRSDERRDLVGTELGAGRQ